MSLEECNTRCLNDIWCTAYAVRDTKDGGPGCFLWFGDLVGIGECKTNGQDLFVKVPSLPSKKVPAGLWKKVVPAFVAAFFVLAIGLSVIIWTKKKRDLRNGRIATNSQPDATNETRAGDSDLKMFDFFTVANATNNFSTDNKIGEGGFGPVYKGVLEDGQEIAIKKLARYSEQGNHEFKNEVIYIAKLQHRNLVKLLGYCLHGAEKMLVYEYLPHKSLDLFLFDPEHSKVLDWSKRLDIIKGIARGLLYLHQDSRLRIIHRDLKASNVLLDYGMNPKISDFGTARSFREQDSEGITKRVVGTYGYIAPEYAMHGLFSVKSDVFSYGVLVLEIVSGKTNRRFHHPEHRLNLIGHAWNLFQEGRQMELIDSSIEAASDWTEVHRAVHVGLLCVQQCPEDRPNMASVVHMLEGGSALVQPEQPGFYDERNLVVLLEASLEETSSVQHEDCSVNMVSITQVEGR